ncbi:P-loop containing nucleoside triphosphate hydrolase protein, partial [Suillus paluster]|uniref:P-loop containing nucleoside triphosphate hydrolase protein n=1 Tax=Suillus paluster TaxID=48578 RepID=UPI001B87295D
MSSKKSNTNRSKQSKNDPNAQQPSSEPKASLDDNVSQLLGVTIAAINVTKDLVPINLAKGILGTIANILIIAQSVIKNKSDFLAIVDRCETIRRVLARATKDATAADMQGSLGDALSQLNISVNRINSEVASRKEQGFWKKLFFVAIDRDQIAGWEKDLDRVLVLFSTEAIAGIAIRVEKLALGPQDNANGIDGLNCRQPMPPSRPSMLYGRDDLVAELTNLVVSDEHIALIGPGGMGKSSLAKAILNESLVMEKFAHRRFFVTYDGLDPSTITFDTFMTRFAGVLGIQLAGADPVGQISSFLCSASALIVLDNAETFEEASGSSALTEIPPAIADIADIPGVVLILTSRSRRNAPNVRWITKDIPPLDLSSAQAVFFQIYHHAGRSDAEEDIKDLLRELDFHPLSINLLANAAQQNGWSPATLLKRWDNRHSAVLNHGKGKLQSLSLTMELSLSSPSVQELGEDGRRALVAIAFLPQGLNETLASDLLPLLLQIDTICDVLCRQSLVYRQGSFIKMLAPIRHFVRDSFLPPDSTCLQGIRAFYYCTVRGCSEERNHHADIIISDHLNIEHIVSFDLAHVPDGADETYDVCWQFLSC